MTKVHIDFNGEEKLAKLELTAEEVQRIFSYVLHNQKVQEDCQISVSLVENDEMQAINKQWRTIDAPTDVISIECERPGDPGLATGEVVSLGDIFISPTYVCAQAKRFDTTPRQEATLLLVHALLHLLGYDHEEEQEAQTMEALEDTLVQELLGDSRQH